VEKFILGEKKEWSDAVVEASRDAALSALALPSELGRFLGLAARGELQVRAHHLDDGVRALYSVFQQLLWGSLAATSAVLATVFDGRGEDGARSLALGACTVFGLLLGASLLRGRRLLRRRR
jgi:hypothetical protein